jgi:hypothetical protein
MKNCEECTYYDAIVDMWYDWRETETADFKAELLKLTQHCKDCKDDESTS